MVEYNPIFQNKILLSVILLIIISLISFIIVPNYLKIRTLDKEVKTLTQIRNDQIKLQPLYDQISSRADFEELPNLQTPGEGWFERSKIGSISQLFKELVEKNGLEYLQSNPDVSTLNGNSKLMMLHIVMKGKLDKFRNFLFDIMNLDYLYSLEEIKFNSGQTGKQYMLKAWISIN